MSKNKMSRRHVLSLMGGLWTGAFVSQAEGAQIPSQVPELRILPAESGHVHSEVLNNLGRVLGNSSFSSQVGLTKILDQLSESHLITKDESDALKEIIRLIYTKEDKKVIKDKVDFIVKQLRQKAGNVAVAIASIALDSIDFIIAYRRPMYIVASDIGGALAGAFTGLKLGGGIRSDRCDRRCGFRVSKCCVRE